MSIDAMQAALEAMKHLHPALSAAIEQAEKLAERQKPAWEPKIETQYQGGLRSGPSWCPRRTALNLMSKTERRKWND